MMTKMSLGVTSQGIVSDEDLNTAYDLLVIIGKDEVRPCRRDPSGREIKKDLTPAMLKIRAKQEEDKMASHDVKILNTCAAYGKSKLSGKFQHE